MAGVRVQTGLAVLLVLLSPAARAFKLPSLPLSRSISRRIYEVVSRNHGALSSMKVAGASAGVAAVVSANSAAPMPPKGGATTTGESPARAADPVEPACRGCIGRREEVAEHA